MKGLQCMLCAQKNLLVVLSKRSMNDHFSKLHKETVTLFSHHEFKANRKTQSVCYQKVAGKAGVNVLVHDLENVMRYEEIDITEAQVEDLWKSLEPIKPRSALKADFDKKLVEPFFVESRFIHTVKDINLDLLDDLKEPDLKNDVVCECLKKLFLSIAPQINELDYNLRLKINNIDSMDSHNGILKETLKNETIKRYATEMNKFIWFLLKVRDEKFESLKPFLNDTLNIHLKNLEDLLAAKDTDSVDGPLDEDLLQNEIASVLSCILFTRYPLSSAIARTKCPLYNHLVLTSLDHDHVFQKVSTLSPRFAAYKFCFKLIFVNWVFKSKPDDEEIQEKLKFLHRDYSSPYNTLAQLLALAKSYAQNQSRDPLIAWLNDQNNSMTVDGIPVSLSGLNDCLLKCVETTKVLIMEKLLLNLPLSSAVQKMLDPANLVDDVNCEELGYSFLSDERNNIGKLEKWLFKEIMSNKKLKAKFIQRQSDSSVVFSKSELMKWHNYCDHVMKLLVFLSILTFGETARSSEIETWIYRNCAASFCHVSRNLIVYNQNVGYLGRYNKSSSNTGHSLYIPRFPHPLVQRLLVIFYGLIVPFRNQTLSLVYESADFDDAFNFAFVLGGTRMKADRIRSSFAEMFRKFHTGNMSELLISQYRHVVAGFIQENFCSIESHFPHALQAGHSEKTNKLRYAISQKDLRKVSTEVMDTMLKVSRQWHSLFQESCNGASNIS